jgi:hypothetical protein
MLSGVMLLWFLLTAMAVIFVAWDIQSTPESPVLKAGFVLLTCYTGPFGAFLYVLGCREPLPGLHEQYIAIRWRQVLGSTMHCVAGDGVGILAGAVIAAWFQLPRPAELILEYTRFRFWLDDLPSSFHARHGWRFLQSLTAQRFSA